ncbi:MAG TPA: MBL fold metallo-hydrolase [Actinomycetota bacterium]
MSTIPDLETAELGTSDKVFAGYSAPFVYDAPDGKKIEQTIWGDFVGLLGDPDGDWVEVRARGANGWMRCAELQAERFLDVNFVDVGQGDGCFIVTPADRFLLVDAGLDDNMLRYLSWRFNLRAHPWWTIEFDAAVLTHPDADHYRGFTNLVESGRFHFGALYHNGLVDRAGAGLGEVHEIDGVRYQTDVVEDLDDLRRVLDDPEAIGKAWYPNLLKTVVDGAHATDVAMLSAGSFVPGYEEDEPLSIQVLSPVPERVEVPTGADGTEERTVLRRLGDDGVTKNGHSVTLRLRYRDVSVLLTGDLNGASQRYLLEHYTGFDPRSVDDDDEREQMIASARAVFGSDAAKSCHHGSADFLDEFLGGIDALVTVVSSGDDEPFAHPRPDALGAFGKWGRGTRPLIFSTELARSPNENVKEPASLRREIEELESELLAAATEAERDEVRERIGERLGTLERSIAVYGLINLRTDGHRIVMAQKLERPSPSGVKWDVHRFEPKDGVLQYVRGS